MAQIDEDDSLLGVLADWGGLGGGVGGNGGVDERSEGGDEFGRIVERGHHLKLLDAGGQGMLARLDIDFMQRLDVFGDEGDGEPGGGAPARLPGS